jgi:hypothetical protein
MVSNSNQGRGLIGHSFPSTPPLQTLLSVDLCHIDRLISFVGGDSWAACLCCSFSYTPCSACRAVSSARYLVGLPTRCMPRIDKLPTNTYCSDWNISASGVQEIRELACSNLSFAKRSLIPLPFFVRSGSGYTGLITYLSPNRTSSMCWVNFPLSLLCWGGFSHRWICKGLWVEWR